jgi:hypothetical protein
MSAKHTANHINRTLTWYRENPDAITREGGVDEVIRAMRRRVGKRDGDDFAMWESQHPVTRLRYRSGYWDFEADIALFRSEFAPPAADRPTSRLVPTLPTESVGHIRQAERGKRFKRSAVCVTVKSPSRTYRPLRP